MNKEYARAIAEGEYAHVEKLRYQLGEGVYFRSLGESIVDSLVIHYEDKDEVARSIGLEYLRLILSKLQEEHDVHMDSFVYGVRVSLYQHDNLLSEGEPQIGERDPLLELLAFGLVDNIIERLQKQTISVTTERDLLATLNRLLTYRAGRDEQNIQQIAAGISTCLRSRRLIS